MDRKVMLILTAILAVSAAIAPSDGSDADAPGYADTFYCYTYTPTFIFAGSDAQHISWDFGDGTPVLDSKDAESEDEAVRDAYAALLSAHGGDVWAPVHEYAAPGSYDVVQTVWNPYDPEEAGDGSSATGVYLVTILGHPTVTLVSEGEEIGSIEVPKGGPAGDPAYAPGRADAPADPERDGFVFAGWYSDEGFDSEYDWDSPVAEHVTLYARWAGAPGVGPDTASDPAPGFAAWLEDVGDALGDDPGFAASVAASAAGALGALLLVRRGGFRLAMAMAALAVVAAASAFAEFDGSSLAEWISGALDLADLGGAAGGEGLDVDE